LDFSPPGCAVTGAGHHKDMISSRQQAPKYGCGHLLVDGTDTVITRKASFAFNPGRRQERLLKKKYSRSWKVLNRRISRLYAKASRVADNFARETAHRIVTNNDVVVLEDLKLANMTRSAKGTVAQPGKNVAAKSGLNKKMSEAALGRLRTRICIKAEEAGCRVWVVPAHHTSQTCPSCGHVCKENRATQAKFKCVNCGHVDHADVNAAVNIAARGFTAEAAWYELGSPSLARTAPRLRRRKEPAVVHLVA
jgi:putative transposase